MTIQYAARDLIEKLQSIYDVSEARNITEWVLESLTTLNRLDQKMNTHQELTSLQIKKLEDYTGELLLHRPVQYVLGECYFMDMKLFVDEHVLVPRPETEELVDWIIKYCQSQGISKPSVLDIGTGSGCIALGLKKHIPDSKVTAIDISSEALQVAQRNAGYLNLKIDWKQLNMLKGEDSIMLPSFDIIVSNPPYITLPEQEAMLQNVLEYEPHQALFVTDGDPQQFYKAIAQFATSKLNRNGRIFMELNRDFAIETKAYYDKNDWQTILKKDMQENDRMLMAWKS